MHTANGPGVSSGGRKIAFKVEKAPLKARVFPVF